MHFKLNFTYLKHWILKNSINQAEKKKKKKIWHLQYPCLLTTYCVISRLVSVFQTALINDKIYHLFWLVTQLIVRPSLINAVVSQCELADLRSRSFCQSKFKRTFNSSVVNLKHKWLFQSHLKDYLVTAAHLRARWSLNTIYNEYKTTYAFLYKNSF